jgi:hypothetical protein
LAELCDIEDRYQENARIMLQIHHERSNQLANMLIALNGFMLAFIAALIAFVGGMYYSTNAISTQERIIPLVIAVNIAIFVIIFWRMYSHYIDDDIVENYCKILRCEEIRKVEFDISLLKSLIFKYSEVEIQQLLEPKEKRYEKIFNKFGNGEIPDRGQKKFDSIASAIIVLLFIVQIWMINDLVKTVFPFFFWYSLVLLIGAGGTTLFLTYKYHPKFC